ncbi:MAG: SCO family protein [Pseudomonadota bacterium]
MRQIAISMAALALAACGGAEQMPTAGGAEAGCMTRAYGEIGGPISLIDQTGTRVTEADFKGQHTLVFFGFTYCPDICPMALYTMGQAIDQLPEDIEPPQTVLITVDPERDTPEALATYLSNDAFPDGAVGLTGTPEEIKAAADVFKAGYERIETPDSLAGYTMDHTSLIYLMDEDWTLKTFFTHQDDATSMSQCLAQHLGS